MAAEIYYFSGTGNSLVVARDITRSLNGTMIPIASLMHLETIRTEADVIGIVFPVHNVVNGGVPLIIRNFLSKVDGIKPSTYIFAVCTCGAGSGDALLIIEKTISRKGGFLSAGFTIKMPFNCEPFTKPEDQLKRFQEWNHKLADVCQTVESRERIAISTVNPIIKAALNPIGKIMHSMILKNYRKLAQAPDAAFDEAVSEVDQSYYVDDSCDGCGICVQVCPVNNIEIVDNAPIWKHNCESCLACFVWCPHHSIFGGILSGKSERYHHPDVKLKDVLINHNASFI